MGRRVVSPLENVNGELYVDGISTLNLAEEFDTPLYVMSERRIRENYNRLHSAFSRNYDKIRIFYSAKANTNLSVLGILRREGAGVDTVSLGEVFLSLEAGLQPSRVFFTGTSVRDDELEYLLDNGVIINVDSLSQLKRLLRKGIPEILSVRINPAVGAGHHEHVMTAGKASKFGVWGETAYKAYEIAKAAGVESFGIHMHVGSGVMHVAPFIQAAETLMHIARNVHENVGIDFGFVDFGGGIGIPYRPEESEFNIEHLSDELVNLFRNKTAEYYLGEPELWLEPGRYIVGDAGILLTKVNTIKSTPFHTFAGVDAGFNTLIRPAMYGSYHHILVANKLDYPPTVEYDVAGPLCESGDVLARERVLPKLSEGDLLAILNAGAYGYSMSSQYNSRLRPAEVLVEEGRYELIRERETLQVLLRSQRILGV